MKPFPGWLKKAVILLFWIALWQLLSLRVHNTILLVGPLETVRALYRLASTLSFWEAVSFSFFRICLGFFLALFAGLATGALSCAWPLAGDLLAPPIQLMKSIPVASFVILALIWTGARNLSVFISFLVVYPAIHTSVCTGLSQTDRALLEMAQVFDVPLYRKIFYIYRHALCPYLISACKTSLGMAFKSGIAAEVIGVPSGSIGEGLYQAKIYLSTADLFAWTVTIILLSAVWERIFLSILQKLGSHTNRNRKKESIRKKMGIRKKEGIRK